MPYSHMTPITTHQNVLSSADNRRRLDESISRAMERYKSDFEAVREKSARLRAARESLEKQTAEEPKAGKPARRNRAIS